MPKRHWNRGVQGVVNLDALADICQTVQWPHGLVPAHPEARRLLNVLGVVGVPEERPVTTAAERIAKGARTMGSYAGAAPEKPNAGREAAFTDETTLGRAAVLFRESRARLVRRENTGENVVSCPDCGTELDVPAPAHNPRCPRYPRPEPTVEPTVRASRGMEKSRSGIRQSANERAPDGSLTIGEMNRRHEAVLDAAHTITGCAWCTWTFTGGAAAGREAAAAHRATEHADRAQKKKGRQLGAQFPPRPVEITTEEEPVTTTAPHTNQHEGLAALEAMDTGEPQTAALAEPDQGRGESRSEPSPVTAPEPSGSANAKWTRDTVIAFIHTVATEIDRRPTQRDFTTGRRGSPSQLTFRRLFGTFAEAMVAAGYEHIPKGGHVKRQVRAPKAPETTPIPSSSPTPVEALPSPPVEPTGSPRPTAPTVEPGARDLAVIEPTPFAGLALTGEFSHDARRVRNEAARLRAQAAALDVIADGIQTLAETI